MRDGDDNDRPDGAASPDGVRTSGRVRRSRRRAVVGTAGLLTVLGVGGFVAYQVHADRGTAPTAQNAAPEPGTATSGLTGPAVTATPASALKPSPTSGASQRPKTVEERVAAVRSTAARKGPGVLRPLPSPATVAADDVAVTTSAQDGGTIKVVSARQDLTGYKELGWVAGRGDKVGTARCSDTIRLSADVAATEHPTLLICWRTSAGKSVYSVAVKIGGRPSPTLSVAAIDAQWTTLG
ncbi:hypothetical protein ACQP2Y_35630 [Actinoplanes sp. CA-051413]|uniref:hypothetical protein n=1 Tax=Actinoplanes sp. CA-051413 TaxID=3239899 RepID=UPI003D961A26